MKKLFLTLIILLMLPGNVFAYSFHQMEGKASYYWTGGCLGCSSTLKMANGEVLDDKRLTVALTPKMVKKHHLLNEFVGVLNLSNNKWTIARVTDTGGFAKYNRIADLSLATKNAVECSSLCNILLIY